MKRKRLNAIITFVIYAAAATYLMILQIPLSYFLGGSMAFMAVANPLYILFNDDKKFGEVAHLIDLLALYGVLIAFTISGVGLGESFAGIVIAALWITFAAAHKKISYEGFVMYMIVFSAGAMFGMDLYWTSPMMIAAGGFMLLAKSFKPSVTAKLYPLYNLGIAVMFVLVEYSLVYWVSMT